MTVHRQPVEFVGVAATDGGPHAHRQPDRCLDREYVLELARAHEEWGWDRLLFPYGSAGPDPASVAALAVGHTETLQIMVGHRPNASHPTFAARVFATLDQICDGRLAVHFTAGGNDADQAREGDHLDRGERYTRVGEYIGIVKRAWTSREPFSHRGRHYQFEDFRSDVFPVQQPGPQVSFGGWSRAALAAGAAQVDVYCLWGQTLERTAAEIAAVKAAVADRAEGPRIQIAVRPIIAPTEEQAWETAQQIAGPIHEHAPNALIGTPETVAQALLDYHDLGADVFLAHTHDPLEDTIDFGTHVIPIVREEIAKRETERAARRLREREDQRPVIYAAAATLPPRPRTPLPDAAVRTG